MADLSQLIASIEGIIQDPSYTNLTERINEATVNICAGVRMPDGTTSPPMPELMASDTLATTALAYVALPNDYQRGLFYVSDSSGDRILPPDGGNYYSFMLFMNHCYKKDLSEVGSVSKVCVRGKRLYYQGIPDDSEDITVMYYRIPGVMTEDDDEPSGIPTHLQSRLIKHWVCKEIFGEGLEDGAEAHGTGTKYHTDKFYTAMVDLIDFIGVDAEPEYYASGDSQTDCLIGY